MRKNVLILMLICLCVLADAQGRRKNQSAAHAEYGYVMEKGDLNAGFMVKGGYGKIFGDKGFLGKVEGFYQDYEVNYLDNQILPYQKYGINVNAGYSVETLAPLYINAWIGGYGGYETVNNGNNRDPKYNAEIPDEIKGIIYGISGSAEIEYNFARKFSFLTNYTQFYDLKSNFSKSNFGLFAGVKYYIN